MRLADYETLAVSRDARGVAAVALDRPTVRNALNPAAIDELASAIAELGAADGIRAIVLRGNGPMFCAGADLGWMRAAEGASADEVAADSRRLQAAFAALATCPKATIARVHGAALAGALGLVACCDIAVVQAGTRFALSEVRLGLVPGIVSSFLLPKIGPSWLRCFAISAGGFGAEEALRAGLVHEIAEDEAALDERVEARCRQALAAAPEAVAETKTLLAEIGAAPDPASFPAALSRNARARMSETAREGIAAFRDRRKPRWAQDA